MAEKGAHLTETVQNRPSIFDVVASDSLNSTFHPAFFKLAQFIEKQNPRKLGWLTKYYDEIFLLLNGLVQHHYLKTYNGSFSEVFYGLNRRNRNTGRFERRDHLLSMLTLVAAPYIVKKLDKLMNKIKEDILDGNIAQHEAESRQRLVGTYENVKTFYESAKLIQYVAYLTKWSESGIFLQQLCHLQLEYAAPYEIPWTWMDVFKRKVSLSKIASDVVFRGLEFSAFFFQFIQWWQSDSRNASIGALPAPKPIIAPTEYDGICPLCLQKWEIPTVVGVSGYVYCYRCILNYFDTKEMACPVTKCAASIEDLTHLYED